MDTYILHLVVYFSGPAWSINVCSQYNVIFVYIGCLVAVATLAVLNRYYRCYGMLCGFRRLWV